MVHQSNWWTIYKCLLNAKRRMPTTRISAANMLWSPNIQAKIFWLSFHFLGKFHQLPSIKLNFIWLSLSSHFVPHIAQLNSLTFMRNCSSQEHLTKRNKHRENSIQFLLRLVHIGVIILNTIMNSTYIKTFTGLKEEACSQFLALVREKETQGK